MRKIILLSLFYVGNAFANDDFIVKKLFAAYELDDGLYQITDKKDGNKLYLFKDRNKVILHSNQEILHSKECRIERDDNLLTN